MRAQVFSNVYQQWFPNGDASSFASFMFEAFDENRVSLWLIELTLWFAKTCHFFVCTEYFTLIVDMEDLLTECSNIYLSSLCIHSMLSLFCLSAHISSKI